MPARHVDKSFRMSVAVVHKVPGAGPVACGKIDRGGVKVGDAVMVSPGQFEGQVVSLESYHVSLPAASAGDDVGLAIKFINAKRGSAASVPSLRRGMIISRVNEKPPTVFDVYISIKIYLIL